MIIIMAALIWISLQGIATNNSGGRTSFILRVLTSANTVYLLLFFIIGMISHAIRAERWKLLINPLGYNLGFLNSFYSVMIGYFINLVIPRGGEISRCVNINRLEKIPIDKAIGTVVAERAVDLVFLIVFIGIAFLVELGRLLAFIDTLNVNLSNSASLLIRLGMILLVSMGLFYLIFRILLSIRKIPFLKFWVNVKKVFRGVKEGLLVVFRLEKNKLFIVYSILIWVFYFLMTYSMLLAFPETEKFGLSASLALFALAGIAMAVPLPGGTGSYHIIVPAGLVFLYGIAEDKATAFTFIFHGWQTLIFIIVGVISIILSQIKAGSISKKNKE